MRFFNSSFRIIYCKNLIWIYLLTMMVGGYHLALNQIPNHMYVVEGQDIDKEFGSLIKLRMEQEVQETFAGFGEEEVRKVNCYLFGLIPMKQVEVSVLKEESVFVSGRLVGIYERTDGVLVLDTETICDSCGNEVTPARKKVHAGDYIISINEKPINTKAELIEEVAHLDGKEIKLEIRRGEHVIPVKFMPVLTESGAYMLGLWIKDDMAGIGTMTYYTKNREFGALGHGIGDGTTGELLSVVDGAIYHMELTGISKGKRGEPGELSGMIYYGKQNHLGTLQDNGNLGIYGLLDAEEYANYKKEDRSLPICYKQDIKTGDAEIWSDITGKMCSYKVKINAVDMNASDNNKGILLKVTDEKLLDQTGGIVQGMSGSPIIQNGKIIGAVTHVLVNDPTKGYGIFIETMLKEG